MIHSLLVLAGTVLSWATLDALRKFLAGRVPPVALAIALSAGTIPGFVVWAAIDGFALPAPGYWPWALSAGVLNVSGATLLLAALRIAPISIVIPLLSLTPVMSAVMAVLLLGESPDFDQWFGMGLVMLGAGVLSASGEGRANVRGVLMGALVAFCFAATVVLDKGALAYATVPVHGVVTGVLLVLALGALLLVRGQVQDLRQLRASWPTVLLAAGVLGLALGLQLLAVQLWLVSVVEGVKRAFGISASALVGRLFFRETLSAPKLFAIALMVGGIGLLV